MSAAANNNTKKKNRASAPKNVACPPFDIFKNASAPLPPGFKEYAEFRVQEHQEEYRKANPGGGTGGACSDFGGDRCVCGGIGCKDLWEEWIAYGCPEGTTPRSSPVGSPKSKSSSKSNSNSNFNFAAFGLNNNGASTRRPSFRARTERGLKAGALRTRRRGRRRRNTRRSRR
jgi:hypothetical protein